MNECIQTSDGNYWRNWRKKLLRLVGAEPQTREQILEILREAKQKGILDVDALAMIEGVLQVSELQARHIMVPQAQVTVVRRTDSLDHIVEVMRKSAHSRFPVIGDDRSEVVGLLLAKDLVTFFGKDEDRRRFNIRDLLRAAVFVPESKRLNVLLKEFRASHNHMAIVVDEYGNAAGIVTIEDVLEQIVGEIEDEHDFDDVTPIFKRSHNEYTIKSHLSIDEFNQYFGSAFSENEFDTIGGLVVNAIGHLPKSGDCIEIGRFFFKILRADSRRVYLLNMQLLTDSKEIDGNESNT